MKMFQKLSAYKKVHKNTMVPTQYDEDPPLGRWVGKQRSKYKNDDMLPSRITLLNSTGFVWGVDDKGRNRDNEQWMKMFQKLVAYKKVHETTLVPYKQNKDRKLGIHENILVPTKYRAGPKLGIWVNNQRRIFKNNKLLQARFDMLDSVGFVWRVYN
jgi:hypothetical protein